MLLLSDVLSFNVLTFLTTLLVGVIIYFKWSFSYWNRRGLECIEPTFPLGNTTKLITARSSFAEQFAELYHQLKQKGLKHGGVYFFTRPMYVPVDPLIIKDILQKDFAHFVDRGFHVDEEHDPLSGHLFSLEGTKWRNLRAKLSATFTSGKMRMMFETMANCASELNAIMVEASKSVKPVEVKEVLSRFTVDVISSCAFGLESNSLKNPDAPMRKIGKRVVENTVLENFRGLLVQFMLTPKWLDFLKIKGTKPDVEDFILKLVKDTVEYREKNNITRKDFLHLLIQLKNKGKIDEDDSLLLNGHQPNEVGLNIKELAAQVFVFFGAGFETSSTTMSFALYELSKHQEIQDKLRNEIRTVLERNNNEISYDALMQMPYLDQVVNETLRKYPALAFLNRKCTKAYHVPETNIHLEEGTMVVIPTLGLHYDPDYYPDPEKFDPERFSEENKATRLACTFLPFGEGPRICIGMRFGLLQSKLGLVTLLKNHKVTLSTKTKEPLVINSTSFTTATKDGIWLNVTSA